MIVVITGASKGIGKSIATAFAQSGNVLLLCARNAATLELTSEEIKKESTGVEVHYMAADLSKKAEVLAFASWCLGFGVPEILVNNAGSFVPGPLLTQNENVMEQMMNINFYSAYYLCQQLVPAMQQLKRGHIFNICSVAALKAYQDGGCYSISKFALDGLSKNLRYELMEHGIKVTSVYPGAVLTDSWGNFNNDDLRIMEAADIAAMVYACSKLSVQAVVEEILLRPQLGDL